jgi:hypothetical protein
MNNTFPDSESQTEENQALKTSFRIAAGMLFVSAGPGIISSIIFLMLNGWKNLGLENIVISIINIAIGVTLWQTLEGSSRNAVRWAFILVLYGIYELISGNSYAFILNIAFSGSLILLLTGKPSKARTITSVIIFIVVYLGLLCLGFTSYFLLGVR